MTTGQPPSHFNLLASHMERILPVAVLLVAVILRLHNLDTIPRGLTLDEAWNGIDALRILGGELPLFLTDNFGREALFVYLQAISIAFLGQNGLALRAVSAIIGILTVVVTYFLFSRMFTSRVALLASGWLSISLWHVIFSRTGLRSVSLPLFLALGFYCIWRGLEGARAQAEARYASSLPAANNPRPTIWFALGGIVIGLSLYTYSVARFAPLVIVALGIYIVFLHRRLIAHVLPGIALALILTTLVFLPEGLFFLRNPESFLERAHGVWVFNPVLHQGNPAEVLFESAVRSLGMFAIYGDPGWPHNISGRPIFDPLSALLMLVGLGLAVLRFRQPAYGFVIIWLVVMFVPSLLAITYTPNYLRASALIPALFTLPALGTMWLWEFWESRVPVRQPATPRILHALPMSLVALALLGGASHTYYSYFESWAKAPELPQFFNMDRHVLFEVAHELAETEQTGIFVAGGDFDDPWVQFTQVNVVRDIEKNNLKTFNHLRSVIFPPNRSGDNYLFASDLPHASIVARYFDHASMQAPQTAPSGRSITLIRLLDPRPPFEPEVPVPAKFADQVFVYGYDFPKDARAGEIITVRWYWDLLVFDDSELAFTNQIFDVDGRRHGQSDDRGFAPGYWPIGTSGITTFEIEIDPEASTGAYWLQVAMYNPRASDISNLSVFDTDGNQAGNHLRLGPIKIHGRQPTSGSEGLVSNRNTPDYLLSTRFADQIDLQGYTLSDHRLSPGESVNLILIWSPRGRPTHDYTVFVHLLDNRGQLREQADSPPASGRYPTSVWDAGEFIADLHTLSLKPDLPSGEYKVVIGLYDPQTGQRVPTVDENGTISGDHLTISGLVVEGK